MKMMTMQWILLLLVLIPMRNGLVAVGWIHRRFSTISASTSLPSVVHQRIHLTRCLMNQITTGIEDGVSLTYMKDFAVDGQRIGEGVKAWLDKEYIPLAVHGEIGEKVSREYVNLRRDGADDLGEIMMGIGTSLESFDLKDAFVNAWDIANKVSDLLLVLMDRETCECAGNVAELIPALKPFDIPCQGKVLSINVDNLKAIYEKLEATFSRYQLIQDFFDGEVSWEKMLTAVMVVLGYRVDEASQQIRQYEAVSPLDWENLHVFPDFSDDSNEVLAKRMLRDYPEKDVEILLQALIGQQYYSYLQRSTLPINQHKIRLIEWICIHGFLTEKFPLSTKYVPLHLESRLEL